MRFFVSVKRYFREGLAPAPQRGQAAEGGQAGEASPRLVRGFTFIEAMVAILVLTLGLTAILQVFPVALGTERLSQMRSQAVSLAQAKVEHFSFQGYENIEVGDFSEPSLETPFEDFTRETKIRYVDSAFNEVGADQGLKKIEVKVFWQGALFYPEKEVEITTLFAEK